MAGVLRRVQRGKQRAGIHMGFGRVMNRQHVCFGLRRGWRGRLSLIWLGLLRLRNLKHIK